jgi:NADH-quinone oxidoreductase subunit A
MLALVREAGESPLAPARRQYCVATLLNALTSQSSSLYSAAAWKEGGVTQYIPILVFTLVALAFPIVTLLIAKLLRAGRFDPVKAEPYECGVPATSLAHDTRFSIRYYLIAVLFVVFDVETVFLFPWAVMYRKLALFGFIEMLVFLAILVVGYIYAWRRGALQWA